MASYCRDAYGVSPAFMVQLNTGRSNAPRDTGRHCGDYSSKIGRPKWWKCKKSLEGPLQSRQGIFRCSTCLEKDKNHRTRAEEKKDAGAQQGGSQQGGAQQGGAPQGGAQQGGAQQGGIRVRVHNLCVSVGVDPNGSLVDLVAVLETSLFGNVQAGPLMTRIAALEALVR